MNNLHRSLAPISDAAWAAIDDEARQAFSLRSAGRRVVDVPEAGGPELASIDLGHLLDLDGGREGVRARMRTAQPLVEMRVPFSVTREAVDSVERGAMDPDWDPVDAAVATLVDTEDAAILNGWREAGIVGLAQASSHDPVAMPDDPADLPDAVAKAVNAVRLAAVEGPYDLVLPQDVYTAVSESTDHGYPVSRRLPELLEGGAVRWAPGTDDAVLVSQRGGDATLYLGRDASIGYDSHDAERVHLYLEESFTVLVHTPEAAIRLSR